MVSSGADVAVGLAAGVPRSARLTALAAMSAAFDLPALFRRTRVARSMMVLMRLGLDRIRIEDTASVGRLRFVNEFQLQSIHLVSSLMSHINRV